MVGIIVLGGKSIESNQIWVNNVGAALEPYASSPKSVKVIEYDHWSITRELNLGTESLKLRDTAKSFTEEPYLVIAKSIGTVIALRSRDRGLINPAGIVGCGLPFYSPANPAESRENLEKDLPRLLEVNSELPTWIVQNSNERFIHPVTLERYLEINNLHNYKVIKGTRDVHQYNILFLAQQVEKYITAHNLR